MSGRTSPGKTSLSDEELNVDLLLETLDRLLPNENRVDQEDLSEVLAELRQANINTPAELEELVRAHLDEVLRLDAEIVAGGAEDDYEWAPEDADRRERGVFFSYAGLVREMLLRRCLE